jgi:hypothetical protein
MQTSVRQDHPSIADIIQNESNNGYEILYHLAKSAGKHPLLIRFPSEPQEPQQTPDMTVNQYRIAWTQYLQYRLFDGTVYSDRYFMQQFVRRLHPSINQRIGSHVLHAVDKVPIDRALPKTFSPTELKHTLKEFTEFANLPTTLLDKTPRQYQQQSQAVRALYNSTSSAEARTNDIDLPAIVAALNNTSASTCFLCKADNHRMAQCAIYQRLRDNPRAITALLRQLRPHKSTSRQRGPPREIRQVFAEDTSTDEAGEGLLIEAGEGNVDDNISIDNATTTPPQEPIDTLESDFL